MLVDCYYTAFLMMLNNSARPINASWWVSFILANVTFDVGFYNALIKSRVAIITASADETLGIFTFC